MYDDVILSTSIDLDLPPKPNRLVVIYDDILSQNDQDLKQSASKPKVMYDEVIPPCRQDRVSLKKNTAYRPAESNISPLQINHNYYTIKN